MNSIAIIGAGRIGTVLESLLRRAGNAVTVSADPESNIAAMEGADIVVLAVPWNRLNGLAESAAPAMVGKIVIDATNPFSETFEPIRADAPFASGAAQNASRFGDVRIVKAFNTLPSNDLATRGTSNESARVALTVSGDNRDAKQVVFNLIEASGYEAVDLGPLANAFVQEPGGAYFGRVFSGTEIRNGEVARKFVERVLGMGDRNAFDTLVAEDIVVTSGISPLAPMVGKAAFWSGLGALAAFSDATLVLDDLLPSGERVTVRYTAQARHTGDQLGVPATNKRITMREIRLMRIADGRIVEDFVADINYDWPWLVAPAYREAWLADLA